MTTVASLGIHIVDILGRPVTAIPPGQNVDILEEIRITVAGTAAGTSIDMAKLGREHVSFTEVKLSDTTEKALSAFTAAVKRIPEVEQCHMIAGSFDFLLKVRTRDIAAYRRILGESISALPHVANTSTYVSMQAVKDGPLQEV